MSTQPFRFQPLLNWAEQREEQQMLVLANALHEEQSAVATLDALVRQREGELAVASEATHVDPYQRLAAEAYLLRLESQIEAQRGVVMEARGRVDLARVALIDLEQEKQSLERLREQDEQRALEEQNRREASVTDDLNMTRHVRRTPPFGGHGDADRGVA